MTTADAGIKPGQGRGAVLGVLMRSGPILGLLAVLLLFVLLLSWNGQLVNFVKLDNIRNILHKSSIPAVAALGLLLIIISGGIDLSVGSVVALATVSAIQVFRLVYSGPASVLPEGAVGALERAGLAWAPTRAMGAASVAAIAAGVLTGGLCGLANGVMITRLRVAPFVVTLGMLSIARGIAVWLAGRRQISFPDRRPGWVDSLAQASNETFVFDPGVWSAVVLAVIVAVVLHTTVFGRYVYAIGSNEATARLCGVPIGRTKVWIYSLAGLLAGWAGILVFAHGSGGNPSGNVGLELDVIAAVVIGGASLNGGQGNVLGTMLGVLILGVLENGVSLFNVPVEVKYILIGVIIIANTALAQWQRRFAQ